MKFLLLFFLLVPFYTATLEKTFVEKLSDAAISLTKDQVVYDPSYYCIKYPNGDVPKNKGVCTDVVIRAYRKMEIDLQKEVHLDMKSNFSKYPKIWGLKKPDTDIDHRRVPYLQVYFSRFGQRLGVSKKVSDYKTGDIVTWMIGTNFPHTGIVTHRKTADGRRNLIVHNVGNGQVLEDCLFRYKITGHYRYGK